MDLFVFTFRHENALYRALSPLSPAEVEQRGLPSHAVLGQISALLPAMTPDQFEQNADFVALLHDVCREYGPLWPTLVAQAQTAGTGEVALIDQRAGAVTGQIANEDIIGVFDVRRGVIMEQSYRPNPDYHLLTDNGPIQLPDFLEQKLIDAVRSRSDEQSLL